MIITIIHISRPTDRIKPLNEATISHCTHQRSLRLAVGVVFVHTYRLISIFVVFFFFGRFSANIPRRGFFRIPSKSAHHFAEFHAEAYITRTRKLSSIVITIDYFLYPIYSFFAVSNNYNGRELLKGLKKSIKKTDRVKVFTQQKNSPFLRDICSGPATATAPLCTLYIC